MSLNATKQPGSMKVEPMEPATYPARTVIMVDLGLQARPSFAGKEKPPVNMISVTYEFVDVFMQDDAGEDILDKPRHLSETFPLYSPSAERAKSTARLKALAGSDWENGDFATLLDVPCLVTIVHNPRKDGGVWENIAEVSPMRSKDADKCPPLVNEARFFDLDDPDLEVFLSLPAFLQKKVKENLEFEGSKLADLLGDSIPFDDDTKEVAEDAEDNPY